MNSPHFLSATKAFAAWLDDAFNRGVIGDITPADLRTMKNDFAARVEAQARALDQCRTGADISVAELTSQIAHALARYKKARRNVPNEDIADRAFWDHLKPHLEMRLFR